MATSGTNEGTMSNGTITKAADELKAAAGENVVNPAQKVAEKFGASIKGTSDSALKAVTDNVEKLGRKIEERASSVPGFPQTAEAVGASIQRSAKMIREKGIDGLVGDTRRVISSRPLTAIACVAAAVIFLPRLVRR